MEQEVFKLDEPKLWVLLGMRTRAQTAKELQDMGFDVTKKKRFTKREILERIEEETEETSTTVVEFQPKSKYQVQ